MKAPNKFGARSLLARSRADVRALGHLLPTTAGGKRARVRPRGVASRPSMDTRPEGLKTVSSASSLSGSDLTLNRRKARKKIHRMQLHSKNMLGRCGYNVTREKNSRGSGRMGDHKICEIAEENCPPNSMKLTTLRFLFAVLGTSLA